MAKQGKTIVAIVECKDEGKIIYCFMPIVGIYRMFLTDRGKGIETICGIFKAIAGR